MSNYNEKQSWAIQRSLDQQEAEANRGLTREEEEALEQPGCQCLGIPEATNEALKRYVTHRIKPGSFVRALLENDLSKAVSIADPTNFAALRDLAAHVNGCLPGECHGDAETVSRWLKEKVVKW